jgi:hypothetical protein
MKKTLIILALFATGAAFAQNTSSDAGSTANSGSSSSINSTAVGNTAASGSTSGSNSGATSGSTSGALGNNVTLNQNVPSVQTINQSGTSTSNSTSNSTNTNTNTNNTNVNGTTTENVKYSGTVENRTSGGTVNTTNENVHYSGTQTVKNVPGIAMSGPASGPCTGASGGLGLAGPGFGVGLNGAKVDDGCTVRENTRVLGQLFQSLDSANPAKAEAQAALLEGMAIIRNMNAKIGGSYAPPPAPKQAEAAPTATPATVKAEATPAPMVPQQIAATDTTITDPFIRRRMGLTPLK